MKTADLEAFVLACPCCGSQIVGTTCIVSVPFSDGLAEWDGAGPRGEGKTGAATEQMERRIIKAAFDSYNPVFSL